MFDVYYKLKLDTALLDLKKCFKQLRVTPEDSQ